MKKIFIKLYNAIFNPSHGIKRYYRLSRRLHLNRRIRYLRMLPWLAIVRKYNCYISPKSDIHPSTYFPHPTGIVIGDGVEISENCTIYQHVTIGARKRGDGKKNLYPKIKENSTIYAGAVIIGDITIEKNTIIAANAVVTKSFPANCVLAGAPARPINKPIQGQPD